MQWGIATKHFVIILFKIAQFLLPQGENYVIFSRIETIMITLNINMSDSTFNRKILSLKRKRPQAPAKEKTLRNPQAHKVQKSAPKKDTSNHQAIETLAETDITLSLLQKQRKSLLKQINTLQQRLSFISSEPLQKACNELKQQDIKLLCRINEHLIATQVK